MAPVRQEPPNSPPAPPFTSNSLPSPPLTNSKPERGESTMNGQSTQRYVSATKQPPMTNHMRSTSISSLTSNKSSDASREQHDLLKSYLADHIAKEKQNGVNPQRSNARDRLQNLSKTQFSELSTDVFDELSRRMLNDANVPSLPPQEEFQPKRNQARQKLAFLPEPRFKDLASDIFFDLDRRYPDLREPKAPGDFKRPPVPPIPNNEPLPPPKRKDSAPAANGLANNTTTIVPTKSTITYEPVDYKIQTGVPSLPPTPHRSDSNSPVPASRNKDSSAYDKNNSPIPNIPRSDTPPERSRAMNTMSSASISSSYTNSSVRSNPFPPRDRRDTNQSDRSKPPLPRAPMPNGSASPINGTPSVSSVSFKSLDSLMADLGNMITTKPGSQPPSPVTDLPDTTGIESRHGGFGDRERDRLDAIAKEKDDHKEEIAKLKEDYESRIAALKKRITQLESESEEKRSQNSDSHRVQELEDEIAEYKKLNQSQTLQISQLQERFDHLDDDYHKLDEDYRLQQQSVDDVQKETTSLLEEIKELSKRNDELTTENDQISERLRTLETDSKSWQTKYEKTKTDLRNLKATSSFVREPPKIDVFSDNVLRPIADGAVEQARVIEYQASIDDLLRAGRSENPSSVLLAMKSIVLSCKLITEDVENFESKPPADYSANSREKLNSLKANFSTTLTYLMKAAKAHATGMGISPVSLLDAAASHLTTSVVDIVKFVGMRKSRPEDEDRRREDKYRRKDSISSVRSNGGYGDRLGVSPNRNSVSKRNSLSIGGAWSGREMGGNNSSNGRSETDRGAEMQPSELKAYLERQTDVIIQSIQSLLVTLRGPTPNVDVSPSLNTITSTVTNVISTSRATFALPQSSPYRLKGDAVLRDLEASVQKLSECQENLKNGQDTKLAKSKLASVSFEIAKFTKELMGIL